MVKVILLLVFAGLTTSCVVVREYDRAYLNDGEMVLGAKGSERFETYFQIYREAASGANGGRSGGGCGCN
ncbi:MAG: arginine decarboxylase [Maribacter sp.]|nr:MAG: arginine decarboxylase [Maribacter sp.]